MNNENLDNTIMTINKWYRNYMNSVSVNVSTIVNEKLKNNNK
jgi:hypothetical protein